jgi:hypothetical protein
MDEPRRPRLPGRLTRRGKREPVPAFGPDNPDGPREGGRRDGEGDGGDGSAGVREPRRPKPLGPMSGAGEAPPPAEPLFARLGDPRH